MQARRLRLGAANPDAIGRSCYLSVTGSSGGLATVVALAFVLTLAPLPQVWTTWMGDGGVLVLPTAPVERPPDQEPEARWIDHRVVPRESVEQIAARYGVSAASVRFSNDLSKGLEAGRTVRVKARRFPRPKQRLVHRVREGDSWVSIAVAHAVRFRDLRAWNWKVRRLRPGRELEVWVDPDRPRTVYREKGPSLPIMLVRDGALSHNRPQKGWLRNGVRLPPCHLYSLKSPGLVWGSTHAVRTVLTAIARFRHDAGYRGELILGSMSRRRGGPFAPHASHRSGRDIDIFLPLVPVIPHTWAPNPHEVDWEATWALIKALVDTGEVEMIFLAHTVQRYLFEAGRQLGASEDELERIVEWPRLGDNDAVVKHGKDHTRHIHVRIRCGPRDVRCYSRWGDERYLAIEARDKAEERQRERK